MKLQVLADALAAAREAATIIAATAGEAIRERGRFILAVSGGQTPWLMLRSLAGLPVPWNKVYLAQVDERLAPAGDPDRNLTHIQEHLLSRVSLPPRQMLAMPVEAEDLAAAAVLYARTLQEVAGTPPVFDLVHLGLGADGHTASLIPGDPVLGVTHQDVALTRAYQGRPRMTLTYPILNRARTILWLVTGEEKAEMLMGLHHGDASIPAGLIRREEALIIADQAAASKLGRG